MVQILNHLHTLCGKNPNLIRNSENDNLGCHSLNVVLQTYYASSSTILTSMHTEEQLWVLLGSNFCLSCFRTGLYIYYTLSLLKQGKTAQQRRNIKNNCSVIMLLTRCSLAQKIVQDSCKLLFLDATLFLKPQLP